MKDEHRIRVALTVQDHGPGDREGAGGRVVDPRRHGGSPELSCNRRVGGSSGRDAVGSIKIRLGLRRSRVVDVLGAVECPPAVGDRSSGGDSDITGDRGRSDVRDCAAGEDGEGLRCPQVLRRGCVAADHGDQQRDAHKHRQRGK